MACVGLALGIGFLASGDRGSAQAGTVFGVDPFEVLNLQIKNNVLFVLDTSGSMSWVLEGAGTRPSSDDPSARMYQAKRAIESVVQQNVGTINMGLATFNVPKSNTRIQSSGDNGTLVYVSEDAGAANFLNFFTDFWDANNDLNAVDGTSSEDIYRSYQNDRWGYNNAYPAACTAGVDCRYFLESAMFRSGRSYTWNRGAGGQTTFLTADNAFTCPNPPAGLTGVNPDNDGDGTADLPRPCFQFVDSVTGTNAIYYMTGGHFQRFGSPSNCGGAAVLQTVADCSADNSNAILVEMQPEIFIPPTWTPGNAISTLGSPNSGTDLRSSQPAGGVRATQSTPLAGSIDAIRTVNPAAFPPEPAAVAGLQKNFLILLTDGEDTCAGGTTTENAIAAAQAAKQLFDNTGDFTHWAETLVVAFTAGINPVNANYIAQGGSGAVVANNGTVTCPGSNPCRDAFLATNQAELVDVLNNALELAASTGTFSAAPSIIGTVYELVVPPADPLDPTTRYDQRVNILFTSLFDIPTFDGHLAAFRNDGTFQPVPDVVNFTGDWEAGETLFENISDPMAVVLTGSRGPVNEFLFADLHDNQTVDSIGTAGAPAIRRRIFTSSDNGRFLRSMDNEFDSSVAAGRNVVALWPPNQAGLNSGIADIDPAVGIAGPFDDVLGIGAGSTPVMTFADLQTTFRACAVTTDIDPLTGIAAPAPPACLVSDIDTARKEARQVILAWIGGAQLGLGLDGLPRRNGQAGLTQGELIYKDRGWLMRESTLAAGNHDAAAAFDAEQSHPRVDPVPRRSA